jgi:hypothetical protein
MANPDLQRRYAPGDLVPSNQIRSSHVGDFNKADGVIVERFEALSTQEDNDRPPEFQWNVRAPNKKDQWKVLVSEMNDATASYNLPVLVGSHVGVLKVIADIDPDNKRLWGQCTLFLRLPEEVMTDRGLADTCRPVVKLTPEEGRTCLWRRATKSRASLTTKLRPTRCA